MVLWKPTNLRAHAESLLLGGQVDYPHLEAEAWHLGFFRPRPEKGNSFEKHGMA